MTDAQWRRQLANVWDVCAVQRAVVGDIVGSASAHRNADILRQLADTDVSFATRERCVDCEDCCG